MVGIGAELRGVSTGRRAVVTDLIGEGSEGAVFAVTVDGQHYAAKWYQAKTATALKRRTIGDLVDRGAPSDRFLWPIELLEAAGDASFGYLMPLAPSGYIRLDQLLFKAVPVSYSTEATLAMELAGAFLSLHAQGLCYRDISFTNLLLDPATGRPLVCDNDNVGITGRDPSAVLGTKKFMAPEIVRREAGPSTQTDLYSLAVLLFYLLMRGHPLLGRREFERPYYDGDIEDDLFGTNPLFVFDPTDPSNAPIADEHRSVLYNWHAHPQFVRDLFVRAFTGGLHDPVNGRVPGSVWRAAMARLRDTVVQCHQCGRENLYDPAAEPPLCWSCRTRVAVPLRLDVGGHQVVLNETTRVYRHHLVRDYDYDTVVAEVARHPQQADLWGLRNCTTRTWGARRPGADSWEPVEPGRSVRLVTGLAVDFGPARATLVL